MSKVPCFEIRRGDAPLIISVPHLGTEIPEDLRRLYTPAALELVDTDWHLDRLYGFADELNATVLNATISRYVVDLNRPASGESLYPGLITTSLCPTETFRGEAIYVDDKVPSGDEIERRVDAYWRPYHDALRTEISRLRGRHQKVLLWEAHSIASLLPRLFSGRLPDFNFGTADGHSCDEGVMSGAIAAIKKTGYSWVLNGRFKGGFITRRYGQPDAGVHAIQLELAQSTYMEESAPFRWRGELADRVSPTVRSVIEGALDQVIK
ncbi:N-formylglutamate deformylase [Variovorax sp. HW608]|uniref:N-formylglutamate deformylase n=1 Tax=Variovorax sp. HW608 TaxID=1034889 RepID=UPI00081F97F8|nr:N-formylglutamate deformylase [Variovorax sp. HW608]SCK08569.1 N-formylglutamate deformylase [Variovorax sp. HW608]